MTTLEAYTVFVLPALVVGIGFVALWISRREDRQHTPAE